MNKIKENKGRYSLKQIKIFEKLKTNIASQKNSKIVPEEVKILWRVISNSTIKNRMSEVPANIKQVPDSEWYEREAEAQVL